MKESFAISDAISKIEASDFSILVIVLRTLEHTYQKAGACALLLPSGSVIGMVSGGCLEGEFLQQMELIPKDQFSWTFFQYDTRSEEDDLLGSALGCRGVIDLAFISLPGSKRMELEKISSFLARSWSAREQFFGSLKMDASAQNDLVLSLISENGQGSPEQGLTIPWSGLGAQPSMSTVEQLRDQPLTLPKRKQVLVCGAGLDVHSLMIVLSELGLEITITDHRDGALETLADRWHQHFPETQDHRRLAINAQVTFRRAQELLTQEPAFDQFDGILIMSHNLNWDLNYLEVMRNINLRKTYVGLLGPDRRRRELFAKMNPGHPLDCSDLKSPMGLRLGGRGPAAIAVSVAADLLCFWNEPAAEPSQAQVR